MAGEADMIRRDSRCYDPASFFAKAKAIHGDLYDYSDTVLSGSQDPISFKCNRCGTTRTLSQAGSHIRKNRPCGCKPCNSDRLSPCKICGADVSSKVYHAQAKRCKECCDKAKQARLAHKESKHGKNCRVCGVWFVKRDTPYCSEQCRRETFAKPVLCKCSNCNSDISRSPHNLKNPERVFCSRECQTGFQAKHWFEYQKKSQDEVRLTCKTKTKIARSKWANQRRTERRKKSESAKWWSKCMDAKSRIYRAAERTDWDQRCGSALSMLKKRREPIFRLERQAVHSWDRTIRNNKKRLKIDLRTKEQIEWSNKINHTVRACKRRFAARSNVNTGIFGMSIGETQQG